VSKLNNEADLLKEKHEQNNEGRRKKKPVRWGGLIYGILFILIWGGIVYEGYYYSKNYFDKTINNIQQTNAMNVEQINGRLDNLKNEMEELKMSFSSTDETLSSSGSIQEQLNKKIELLDGQLKNLEKSLKILKEAPNAKR